MLTFKNIVFLFKGIVTAVFGFPLAPTRKTLTPKIVFYDS